MRRSSIASAASHPAVEEERSIAPSPIPGGSDGFVLFGSSGLSAF